MGSVMYFLQLFYTNWNKNSLHITLDMSLKSLTHRALTPCHSLLKRVNLLPALSLTVLPRHWKPWARTLVCTAILYFLSPFIYWEQVYQRNISYPGLSHFSSRETNARLCVLSGVDTWSNQQNSRGRTQGRISLFSFFCYEHFLHSPLSRAASSRTKTTDQRSRTIPIPRRRKSF